MPAKLKVLVVPVKWRIRADDLELLRALYEDAPEGVNGVVREVLHAFCARLRARSFPKA